MKSSDSPVSPFDAPVTLAELEAALVHIWQELSPPLAAPGDPVANESRPSVNELERSALEFQAAADRLLATADQALADIREAKKDTRTLLDQIDACLGLHG
ncbi:MAG TPA: hypothetical protein VGQ90_11175 [Stellaceae bacterium]|nr:hypothetical protein [Stellaceae bacterium]